MAVRFAFPWSVANLQICHLNGKRRGADTIYTTQLAATSTRTMKGPTKQ